MQAPGSFYKKGMSQMWRGCGARPATFVDHHYRIGKKPNSNVTLIFFQQNSIEEHFFGKGMAGSRSKYPFQRCIRFYHLCFITEAFSLAKIPNSTNFQYIGCTCVSHVPPLLMVFLTFL